LRERISGHDAQLNQIYDDLENMLEKKVDEENKHELRMKRVRIGFKK
jgi:hypothetical protein